MGAANLDKRKVERLAICDKNETMQLELSVRRTGPTPQTSAKLRFCQLASEPVGQESKTFLPTMSHDAPYGSTTDRMRPAARERHTTRLRRVRHYGKAN